MQTPERMKMLGANVVQSSTQYLVSTYVLAGRGPEVAPPSIEGPPLDDGGEATTSSDGRALDLGHFFGRIFLPKEVLSGDTYGDCSRGSSVLRPRGTW